jgi:hypothetical protein
MDVLDALPEYGAILGRLSERLRKSRRTRAEHKLTELLGILIDDYDRRNGLPPSDSTPAELLRFLLDHSGRKPSDLLTVFGQRRSRERSPQRQAIDQPGAGAKARQDVFSSRQFVRLGCRYNKNK